MVASIQKFMTDIDQRRRLPDRAASRWGASVVMSSTLLASAVVGCSRAPVVNFVSSQDVQKLQPELQKQVRGILLDQCGTPRVPKLLGSESRNLAHLQRGAQVYTKYCVQCHGVSGDGNGIAAVYMLPKPRDYRRGIFKFTSTTYGSKPLRDDLLRTLKRGIRGTSMPAFGLLSIGDLDAVVDYVMALTRRGELEAELADEGQFSDLIDSSRVPEMISKVLTRWNQASSQVVYPTTPMPQFTRTSIEQGKKAFLTIGCANVTAMTAAVKWRPTLVRTSGETRPKRPT